MRRAVLGEKLRHGGQNRPRPEGWVGPGPDSALYSPASGSALCPQRSSCFPAFSFSSPFSGSDGGLVCRDQMSPSYYTASRSGPRGHLPVLDLGVHPMVEVPCAPKEDGDKRGLAPAPLCLPLLGARPVLGSSLGTTETPCRPGRGSRLGPSAPSSPTAPPAWPLGADPVQQRTGLSVRVPRC